MPSSVPQRRPSRLFLPPQPDVYPLRKADNIPLIVRNPRHEHKTLLELVPRPCRHGSSCSARSTASQNQPKSLLRYLTPAEMSLLPVRRKQIQPHPQKQLLDLIRPSSNYSGYSTKQLLELNRPPSYPSSGYSSPSQSFSSASSSCGSLSPQKEMLSHRPSTYSTEVCSFCYEAALHVAARRGQAPPLFTDRGIWRGHRATHGDTIICPRLLKKICSICGATGKNAHIGNFCPRIGGFISNY